MNVSVMKAPRPEVAADVVRPRLQPRMDALVRDFLANPAQVFDLADAFGSPLNIMFPQVLTHNVEAFEEVYKRNQLSGRIFFTTKPNKSMAVKRQAAMADVGADVSSQQALLKVMEAGFGTERIEATGPKNHEYLTLALQHDVILNADNLTELEQAVALRKALGIKKPTRLFVRLSGFYSDRVAFTKQDGTFGVHVNDAEQIFAALARHAAHFTFLGFSYYVSGASYQQRQVVIEQALELTFEAMKRGFNPRGLDIGGGFHVRYAEDAAEWNAYTDALKQSVVNDGPQMTWNNSGLGYRNAGGLVSGAPLYMDHYPAAFGADDLHKTLNLPLPAFDNQTAAQLLSENLLDLYIEPGRSMLDQVGITLGRVNFVKDSVHGETLVALDMNRSNMHATHQKLLTEPVVLARNPARNTTAPNGVYYMGNLCVSYDIIQYNKTFPDLLPEQGDLVAFINTGPYIMDFIESETLHQRLADRVAVVKDEGRFKVFKDDQYHPAARVAFGF